MISDGRGGKGYPRRILYTLISGDGGGKCQPRRILYTLISGGRAGTLPCSGSLGATRIARPGIYSLSGLVQKTEIELSACSQCLFCILHELSNLPLLVRKFFNVGNSIVTVYQAFFTP